MNGEHKQILELLEKTFNPEGNIHFLAISVVQTEPPIQERPVHKVRVALTFKEGDGINPYYDGTDIFVIVDGDDISFTREEEWSDGPPLVEGSPIELAVGWVSELTKPFYISSEAHRATTHKLHNLNNETN